MIVAICHHLSHVAVIGYQIHMDMDAHEHIWPIDGTAVTPLIEKVINMITVTILIPNAF